MKEYLYDGIGWDQYSFHIVGNRAGLAKLQDAIGEAIRHGKSFTEISEFINKEEGDYEGIVCLDDSFFDENPMDFSSSGGFISKIKFAIVALFLLAPFLIGIEVIFSKLFN